MTVTTTTPSTETPATFAELGARPETVAALEGAGILTAFPVQELTIPHLLRGVDLIGQAKTGTGKTLGFAVPIVDRVVGPRDPGYADLAHPGRPQALIVTPTRELCVQVAEDLALVGATRGVRTVAIYGGKAMDEQIDALAQGVDVVVGTPGRLLDLARQRALKLDQVVMLTLDEADRMLDMGFLPDVERLVAMVSPDRQTILFSATMPAAIITLAKRFMRTPLHLRASGDDAEATVATTIRQHVYRAHHMDKVELVARVLQAEGRGPTIIFHRTKHGAQRLTDELVARGFTVRSMHGDMSQEAREKSLAAFRDGKVDVMVATDVAARGLDVDGVTHVINYTIPENEKDYVHRIGRTGRAGNTGIAITLVDWDDMHSWKLINEALDLDFADPVETYSSSEHLYTELGIPAGTKGSVPGHTVTEVPRRDRGPRDGAARSGRDSAPRGGGERRDRGPRAGGSSTSAPAPRSAGSGSGSGAGRTRKRTRRGA